MTHEEMKRLQSRALELSELIKSRIHQEFDHECHLTDAEANEIIAALTSSSDALLSEQRRAEEAERERDRYAIKADAEFDRFNEAVARAETAESQLQRLRGALKEAREALETVDTTFVLSPPLAQVVSDAEFRARSVLSPTVGMEEGNRSSNASRAATESSAGWRPIETAPEKVSVLVFDPLEGIVAATDWPYRGKPFWMPDPSARDSDSLSPTHWMPLPEPPAESGAHSPAEGRADDAALDAPLPHTQSDGSA